MSRIGKLIITIPSDVKVDFTDSILSVTGKGGTLTMRIHKLINLKIDDSTITVEQVGSSNLAKGLHGLTRTLVQNMITGVSEGFNKQLEMKGVGYKAEVKDKTLVLNLGFSHPVEKDIPEGLTVEVKKNVISISGADKQAIGEFAAKIRRLRPPEPYKGKGIKYIDEIVRRKAGKAAKATEGAGGAK